MAAEGDVETSFLDIVKGRDIYISTKGRKVKPEGYAIIQPNTGIGISTELFSIPLYTEILLTYTRRIKNCKKHTGYDYCVVGKLINDIIKFSLFIIAPDDEAAIDVIYFSKPANVIDLKTKAIRKADLLKEELSKSFLGPQEK